MMDDLKSEMDQLIAAQSENMKTFVSQTVSDALAGRRRGSSGRRGNTTQVAPYEGGFEDFGDHFEPHDARLGSANIA